MMASGEYLRVVFGTNRFLFPSSSVREILGESSIIRVPHATSGVPGVLPYAGSVIAVIDLAAFLEADGSEEHASRNRTLIIDAGDLTVAVPADQVREVVQIGKEQGRESLHPLGPFATREVELESGLHYFLDVPGLIESVSLGAASSVESM